MDKAKLEPRSYEASQFSRGDYTRGDDVLLTSKDSKILAFLAVDSFVLFLFIHAFICSRDISSSLPSRRSQSGASILNLWSIWEWPEFITYIFVCLCTNVHFLWKLSKSFVIPPALLSPSCKKVKHHWGNTCYLL